MLNFLISSAHAQEAAAAAASTQNPLTSFAPLVIVFIIFYFLVLRPQGKKLKEEQAFLNNLSKGDEIYTKSGILGTITGISDKIVTIDVSEGTKLKILRNHVAGLSQKLFETKTDTKTEVVAKKK